MPQQLQKPTHPVGLKGAQFSPPSPLAVTDSLPLNVAITGTALAIGARVTTTADIDKLVQILEMMKPLLPTIYGQPRTQVVQPDTPDRAQQVFEAATEGRNSEGVSFFVTQAQKEQLRQRGFTDKQIRDMKPEDAHRVLGLISAGPN